MIRDYLQFKMGLLFPFNKQMPAGEGTKGEQIFFIFLPNCGIVHHPLPRTQTKATLVSAVCYKKKTLLNHLHNVSSKAIKNQNKTIPHPKILK